VVDDVVIGQAMLPMVEALPLPPDGERLTLQLAPPPSSGAPRACFTIWVATLDAGGAHRWQFPGQAAAFPAGPAAQYGWVPIGYAWVFVEQDGQQIDLGHSM
jgi:hypothetical protein